MYEMIKTTLADRKGVTAMEYAVIAAGIVIVIAATVTQLGDAINTKFGELLGFLS